MRKIDIEKRILLRAKSHVIERKEPISEIEITGETEEEKQKRDMRNQEKKSTGKIKQQEFQNEDQRATISLGTKQMQR